MDPVNINQMSRNPGAFPPETPVGMAYVPVQMFQKTLEPEVALSVGTIFPDLNKPWLGSRPAASSLPQSQAGNYMGMMGRPYLPDGMSEEG